ncbi:hypothetical protein [Adlercreutzia sp. ZJ473]|uniref:hypothetical protein n=1 Tax=Adlercreutzia sp. ZJ473 TaxID=2722822 RepID=UPI001553FCB5|nr:hypothetical protein [Adlercreutzia sp. ZJ473]
MAKAHAKAKGSHRALKVVGIVVGVIVGIALVAVFGLNIYMRTAYAPFYDRVEQQFSIPGMVQGTCMTSEGYIALSTSYGLATSHLLAYDVNLSAPDGTFTTNAGDEVPLFCLDSRNLVDDLAGPPMLEGIESHEGRLITLDEAASNKYIFGKLYGAGQVYAVEF